MDFKLMLEESHRVFREKHGEEEYQKLLSLRRESDDTDIKRERYERLLAYKPPYYDQKIIDEVNDMIHNIRMGTLTEKVGAMNLGDPSPQPEPRKPRTVTRTIKVKKIKKI